MISFHFHNCWKWHCSAYFTYRETETWRGLSEASTVMELTTAEQNANPGGEFLESDSQSWITSHVLYLSQNKNRPTNPQKLVQQHSMFLSVCFALELIPFPWCMSEISSYLVSTLSNRLPSLCFCFGLILPIVLFVNCHKNVNHWKWGWKWGNWNSSVGDFYLHLLTPKVKQK